MTRLHHHSAHPFCIVWDLRHALLEQTGADRIIQAVVFSFVCLYVDRTRWQELSVEPRLRDTRRGAGGCLGAMLCTRAWLKS